MALSSLNGAAIYGTISTVYPNIRSAVFSSPTTLGQIVIGSITGNFTSYTITRNGGAESASQTAATYTDTSLANNTQYTYTIVPYIGGIKGVAFTTMTNPNNAGTPGKIYTLATITGLNPTYLGVNSTISSVYINWASNGYTSILLANTTKAGANYTGVGTAYNSTTNGSSDSALTTNAQYTYTFTTRNGDAYYVANSNCQTTVNTCTWASAPTLTYNGAGCSTSQISFTFSGGVYSNLSVQYPSGTEITKTITSPYTGGAFSANQQVTYYVYPINALSYISSNGSSVAVCTRASANAPTFSSTTSAGTTLACSGTFSKVYITYTGTAATPASGTTVTGTNSISQGYTGVTAGTYAFSCYAVNALNYQSTTAASNSVTIPSAGYTATTTSLNVYCWYNPSNVTNPTNITTWNDSCAHVNLVTKLNGNIMAQTTGPNINFPVIQTTSATAITSTTNPGSIGGVASACKVTSYNASPFSTLYAGGTLAQQGNNVNNDFAVRYLAVTSTNLNPNDWTYGGSTYYNGTSIQSGNTLNGLPTTLPTNWGIIVAIPSVSYSSVSKAISVFGDPMITTRGLIGYSGDIIIFNTSVTAANRQWIEGWLGYRYNCQSSLPTNHPYYSSTNSLQFTLNVG
jgi:hypothetical protein